MDIILTGGAGFIGSSVASVLLGRGEKVIVIDDFNNFYDPAVKRENIKPFESNPNFILCELDTRNKERVFDVFKKHAPQAVIHLAARAGVRPSIDDPLLYEEVNCVGTLNILEAVKNLKLENFVFASSSSVYGINSKVPFSEEDPITCPISPYASTKRAGELMCYTYSHLYNLPVTCLRFFTVYGEKGRPDMAVAKFTNLIREGREIQVYGDGTAERDFTYIGDIVKGVVSALYNPFKYEIINLGGSKVVSVSRLISVIEENLGKKARVKYLPPVPGDVPITYADVSKATRLLGFEPEVRIEEGVARYVKWFLEREGRKLEGARK
ncbi:NAD-dependent epimerase/dehydratase family protein [bacterium]|nr:MAG: NAD-dependent epimerase/dehydratase family protein [bacterium]